MRRSPPNPPAEETGEERRACKSSRDTCIPKPPTKEPTSPASTRGTAWCSWTPLSCPATWRRGETSWPASTRAGSNTSSTPTITSTAGELLPVGADPRDDRGVRPRDRHPGPRRGVHQSRAPAATHLLSGAPPDHSRSRGERPEPGSGRGRGEGPVARLLPDRPPLPGGRQVHVR